MRNSSLILFLLIVTAVFSVDYSAHSPLPKAGAVIAPINGVVSLSWQVDNPYGKTLSFYLYLFDGEKQSLYGPLEKNNFSLLTKPGKTYSWKIKTEVYDKEYWSEEWNFQVPKSYEKLFGDDNWDYPVDAKLTDSKLKVLVKKLDCSVDYSAYLMELSETFEVTAQYFLGSFVPMCFWNDKVLGYEESKNGSLQVISYSSGSTEAVFPETLSSVQLLKADNDVVICVGRENLKTVALVKKGKSISKIDLFSFSIYDATVVDDGIVFVGTISQENLNFPVVVLENSSVLKWEHQGWLLKVVPGEEKRFFYVLGIVPTPTGDHDVVLRKYTTDGVVLWSKTIDDFRDEIVGGLLLSDGKISVLEAVFDNEAYNQRIFMYSFGGEPIGMIESKAINSEKPQKLLKISSGFLSVGYSYEDGYKTQIAIRFFSEP